MSLGGGTSDSSQNTQSSQNFAQTQTGNQSGQYANGPVNAQQLLDALSSAQGLYQGGNQLTNAGLSGISTAAQNQTANYGAGDQALGKFLGGDYINQGNPYQDQLVQSLTNSIAPAVGAQFEGNGRYGSPLSQYTTASAVANAAAPLAYGTFNQQTGNQLQALNSLPSYTQGAFNPSQAQITAGYTPINQYVNQLASLKPGTAGTYQQANNNNTYGFGNSNSNSQGSNSSLSGKTK